MKPSDIRILEAGDSALIVEFGNEISEILNGRIWNFVTALAESCSSGQFPGISEWVPTFRSVSVYYNPLIIARVELITLLMELTQRDGEEPNSAKKTVHRVPVCYDDEYAPDMHNVVTHSGLTKNQVISAHSGHNYLIYMLGFLPGFAYLGGMDPRLETPRLASPRVKIPAGSVAIGGAQTGIYPLDSPGGWQIIGKTPVKAYDSGRNPPILFTAGDYIRFVPVSATEFKRLESASSSAGGSFSSVEKQKSRVASSGIQVISGGLLTTVQDAGRFGYQKDGFCVSGAMDSASFRLSNALAGNPPDTAVLETTLIGPVLKFILPARFVITGADCQPKLDGKTIPLYQSVNAAAGSMLTTEPVQQGIRSYIAFSGGLLVPEVMGSCSTSTKYGLGGYKGRKLAAGDELAIGQQSWNERVTVSVSEYLKTAMRQPSSGSTLALRVLPGPQSDYFTEKGKQTFTSALYTLSGKSDRMGVRLEGEPVESCNGTDIISDGIAAGSVQIPSAGTPIIMMADRQTTGGYAKIGTVISADLPLLAQAKPGTVISFQFVTYDQALVALTEMEAELHCIEEMERGKAVTPA